MNKEELAELLEEALTDIIPGYEITLDRKGQVIIRTGFYEQEEDGELFQLEEEGEEDPDLDEDLVPLGDEDDDD